MLDRESDLQSHRRHHPHECVADGIVDACPRNDLAERHASLDALALTDVVGTERVSALSVPHGHAGSALAAEHEPLQQRRPLTWRTAAPIVSMCLRLLAQQALVRFVLLPCDVALVCAGQQRVPVVARQRLDLLRTIGELASAEAPEEERASVPRVVQQLQRAPVLKRPPYEFSLSRTGANAAGHEHIFLAKRLYRGARGSCAAIRREEMAQTRLYLRVRVEHDAPTCVVDEADRQRSLQLATPRLVEDAATESCV